MEIVGSNRPLQEQIALRRWVARGAPLNFVAELVSDLLQSLECLAELLNTLRRDAGCFAFMKSNTQFLPFSRDT